MLDWHSLQITAGNLIHASGTVRSLFFHPQWDVVLMFFVVAAVFLYGISTGRGKVVLILLATYMSFGISNFLFLNQKIFNFVIPESSSAKLYIFGGILVFITLLLFKTEFGSGVRNLSWISALVLSVLQSGLLTTCIYLFLNQAEKTFLSPIAVLLVGSPEAQFLWIVGPFLWLLVMSF